MISAALMLPLVVLWPCRIDQVLKPMAGAEVELLGDREHLFLLDNDGSLNCVACEAVAMADLVGHATDADLDGEQLVIASPPGEDGVLVAVLYEAVEGFP